VTGTANFLTSMHLALHPIFHSHSPFPLQVPSISTSPNCELPPVSRAVEGVYPSAGEVLMPRDVALPCQQSPGDRQYCSSPLSIFGCNPRSTQSGRSIVASGRPMPGNWKRPKTGFAGHLKPGDLLQTARQRSLETGVAGLLRPVDLAFAHKLPRVA
jgi:hypothetical protein